MRNLFTLVFFLQLSIFGFSQGKIQEFQQGNNYSTVDKSSVYFDRSNKLENELIDIDLQRSVLEEIKKY